MEARRLRENEIAILIRTEKAMMRAMGEVKLIETTRNQELMNLLSLKDTLDGLARASGVRWYGHVLRRNKGDVLQKTLDFEVAGRKGQPYMAWKRQVKEHTNQIGLKR